MTRRKRLTAKDTLLETLSEHKSDLANNAKAFDRMGIDVNNTPPLKRVFDAAGMNPKKAAHWKVLLLACACSLFPEDEDFSPKGRDVAWTDDAKDRLIAWWLEAKAANPNHGDRKLFAWLVEKHGGFKIAPRHLMDDPESLRQRFLKIKQEARQAVAYEHARKAQLKLLKAIDRYRARK